ncbi:GDSL esterase/lipase At2g38180 [Linum perenne]
MVGPIRPVFVLFGSSIVQFSHGVGGWGAILADYYSRKDAATQPALVIVYLGGNDACDPELSSSHVPLPEYIENMKTIAAHLKGLSKTIRVMFLTPPPVNEEMIVEYFRGNHLGRTNAAMRKYADACLNVCTEMEVTPVDIWPAFQQRADFTDGIHPSAEGSRKIADEIFKVLKQTDGEPSLYWQTMPIEFPGFTDYDAHGYQDYLKLTSRL